jgi:hypothetical protein
MSLALDHARREALLVQVSLAAVATIEALGIHAVQPVHAGRETLARCLDEEVVVGAHETPRVQPPAEHLDDLAEQPPERLPIVIVDVDICPADPARRHMEEAVLGKVRARSTRHVTSDGTAPETPKRASARNRHALVTKAYGARPCPFQPCPRDSPSDAARRATSDRLSGCFRSSALRRSSASG